jgi:CrcB protein
MLQHSRWRTLIAISLGAIAGASSRYAIGLLLANWLGSQFPYGTLFVNLTGCFGMGFVATIASNWFSPDWRLLLTTGFLGSYTTFSSYALDTTNLLRSPTETLALLYWAGSIAFGLLSFYLGRALAQLATLRE